MSFLLLFDIDGTILKFEYGRSRIIFKQMLKEIFDIDVHTDHKHMMDFSGKTDINILMNIAHAYSLDFEEVKANLPQIWKKMAAMFKKYCNEKYIELMPGIKNLIEKIENENGIQLGLLTGNFKENAYLKLQAHKLHGFFPFGAFGSDHEDRNLLPPIALKRANIFAGQEVYSADNTLIIGDSKKDIECAKTNSIPVLAVGTGYEPIEELEAMEPEFIVDDLTDLEYFMKIIDKLSNRIVSDN